MSVDCNDEGALFIESRVNIDMSTFLNRRNLDDLFDFVPSYMSGQPNQPTDTLPQVLIQVNVFTCGGISIGCCLSHKIIDAATTVSFLKCWAAIASGQRGGYKLRHPDLTTASALFPPKMLEAEVGQLDTSWLLEEGRSAPRRFVFDSRAIRQLKAAAASTVTPNPSGSEAVSCFIWKCIMNASEKEKGSEQPWMVAAAKNIRPLTTPPMSQDSVGNIFLFTMANYDPPAPPQLQRLVSSLREGFRKIDVDYIKKLQGDQDLDVVHKMMNELNESQSREKREAILFSSTKAFKFTELDFGWAKPIWTSHIRLFERLVSSPQISFSPNRIILVETAWGSDGIEAWLVFGQKTVEILENDPEFLAYASPNPSISQLLGRL